jgi:hypothetical protein
MQRPPEYWFSQNGDSLQNFDSKLGIVEKCEVCYTDSVISWNKHLRMNIALATKNKTV